MTCIYGAKYFTFTDKIVAKKRIEMVKIINNEIREHYINDILDVGTAEDKNDKALNLIIKKLRKKGRIFKSLTIDNISDNYFKHKYKKSITQNFSNQEYEKIKSDAVISAATIEHVGSFSNQVKMVRNIINLTKKFFFITTPNRFYPIEFHTKLPLIHWLPKRIHRFILSKLLNHKFLAKEKNLNLLCYRSINSMMSNFKRDIHYKIIPIKLLGIVSNYIIIGKKKFK
jgi:hypothetical protein